MKRMILILALAGFGGCSLGTSKRHVEQTTYDGEGRQVEQTVTEEKYQETPLDTALKGAELAARWDALRR